MVAVTSVPEVSPIGEANELLSRYLKEIERIDYASLCVGQRSPWPSIGFGAAGVAYALWRAGGTAPERIDRADALLREAEAAPESHYVPREMSFRGLTSSLYYGPLGVKLVRALVAQRRGDERTYEDAIDAFLVGCGASTLGDDELLLGTAGLLNG